tara:strand:- start:815 stop:1021 length:207 start_codon:yes stop_codon:yes gene_type:complete
MVFTVYVCDGFWMTESGVLNVHGKFAEFSSNDRVMIEKFIEDSFFNAVVCPAIFKDATGKVPSRIQFT